MSWTVYILECGDGTFYTGIAADIGKRLAKHEGGRGAKYTRGRSPFVLIYEERHDGKAAALKREAQIKAMTREAKKELVRQYAGHDPG